MSKKRFIQSASAILLFQTGEKPCVDKAVRYAEKLWEKLTEKGYGASTKEHRPRSSRDYYKLLSEHQRKAFNLFWNAFGHKHGRDGAAMRFGQLGELTSAEYKIIIEAAKKESLRQLPYGQSRIMAQGWLEEKRYNDYTPAQKSKASSQVGKSNLRNEMASLNQLQSAAPSPTMAKRIKEIERKLKA
ncbi:MAG: hypothetical protein AB1Y26_07655 [Cycloclasticus sp.]